MIKIDIDQKIIERAIEIAQHENIQPAGAVDRSLSGKGKTNIWCGAIGQAVFERAMEDSRLQVICTSSNRDDYRSALGRIEVKTKERAVAPLPHYEASIYDYNKKNQDADWYAFVSLRMAPGVKSGDEATKSRYDQAWLCGLIERSRFERVSAFVPVGSPLPNGQLARYDSHNVTIAELVDLAELVPA
jgi:hypothetical protein